MRHATGLYIEPIFIVFRQLSIWDWSEGHASRATEMRRGGLKTQRTAAGRLRVLFVQGAGARAPAVDAKLVANLRSLRGTKYEVRYPVMPNESDPDSAAWQRFLSTAIVAMGDGAILVGHSAGATILVMALTKLKSLQRISGLVLIAA